MGPSEDKPLVVGERITAPSPSDASAHSPDHMVNPITGFCAAVTVPVRRPTSSPAPDMVPPTDGVSDFPSVGGNTDTPHGYKGSNSRAISFLPPSGILSIAMSGRGCRESRGSRGLCGIADCRRRGCVHECLCFRPGHGSSPSHGYPGGL
ncbi:hypothetical protein FGB62_54g09 [Gracilaria domingensis]|nr:hypothetical protein FGB62_54g09 [Gracilaria domingensis]